jgi:hypothetical protein
VEEGEERKRERERERALPSFSNAGNTASVIVDLIIGHVEGWQVARCSGAGAWGRGAAGPRW